MTNYGVVIKLIGEIDPVGETNEDNKRYENLNETMHLVQLLLDDLHGVSFNADRVEYSVKRAGETADKFLKGLKYD